MSHIRNFELSCLFRNDLKQGALLRSHDNTRYIDDNVESMYQGYVMAADSNESKLNRFLSTRYISNAFRTNVRKLTEDNSPPLPMLGRHSVHSIEQDVLDTLARAVLQTAADLPG